MTTATRTVRTGPRKVRLDTQKIIAAGLKVATEHRSSTFSAKRLGTELGVDPSAVYRHFRSKSHLMEALLDELHVRALASITATPDDWRGRIQGLADGTLREYCEHPAIAAEAMTLTTHGPGEFGAMELILSALSTCGLDEVGVLQHYSLISSYTLSMSSGIARARADDGGTSGEPSGPERWVEGPLHADPRTYPHIAHYSSRLTELDDQAIFLAGINALLDAAERDAR
ncbi:MULTISPECIES: TetR/AcrR family transcriptional regulator [unclassified Leucobacter]|uniref:TetR/AcrR family transcriptional regulator n=1 Tax=unclassified Leucobacter TaxID=2621730 RepID=UPI001CB6D992|nr:MULTISPECIES: TetR/AcrR family transcriptional regulator [unclassified Leucobacter]